MTHILLIDDDELICQRSQMWFERKGYEVSVANNGIDGVKAALAASPDVIVCDGSMPHMDGFAVLQELRKHPETSTTPFIFLTAEATRTSIRRGMDLGADDYLTKPFTQDELISAVESRLNRRAVVASSFQREMDEVQGKLARLVTHELKTPLVNFDFIRQIINRQIEQLDQAQIKELLGSLDAGSDRMTHVVDQMVYITQCDTSSLSAAKLHTDGMPVEISPLLSSATALGRRFAFRNKDFATVIDDGGEHSIIEAGHTPSLKHALAEIIANALNYSYQGGQVEIATRRSEGFVGIRVMDHGSGMSVEEQRKALMPFEQIDRERHEQQGLGLGLPLAKKIVEIHGGTFRIRSEQGQGTQVIIRLPISVPSADNDLFI